MRMPPLLADFIHARVCKSKCEKFLTVPAFQERALLDKMIALHDSCTEGEKDAGITLYNYHDPSI